MIDALAGLFQRFLRIPSSRTRKVLHTGGVIVASASFVLIATVWVSYDSIFLGANDVSTLKVGDIAPQDIRAPFSLPPYISHVLTEQRKAEVSASVPDVYFLPNAGVARRQSDLAEQILVYIENIRRDPFGTPQQKLEDLHQISDLTLDESVIVQILAMDDITWRDVSDQIANVLERVMRGEIRESDIPSVRTELPTQVSVRFSEDQSKVIVAVVEDLVRPNTILNTDATQANKAAAVANISVQRSFERGQLVVGIGERIDEAAYEALSQLGLLEGNNQRFQQVIRAGLASITIMVIMGFYISRFRPSLLKSSRFMALLAAIFLLMLFGARVTGAYGQLYIYPTAALALLYVALSGAEIAVIGALGLAALVGIMQNNSLEMTLLVAFGGLMAALTLRRPERLNGYFMPGLLVALTNIAVITIFYQGSAATQLGGLAELILYSLLNGILSAAAALGGMYIVTVLFNLPTGLKLVELSQPNQPLLQRLLREAPGTYQHSLQVANLAEQAANAIGVNADLVRVAALYHDIGKMLNAPFFTENQVEGVNPHDVLNDPYRSADIIIGHVTDGEKMARQYRLPARIRDFILEHHGTQVLYFYEQAVERAGDDEAVDVEQFTYPGPKPQTRETAVLMLADSCEAAVRSRKPTKKQDISDTIQHIFDTKIRTGQLDESGLTFNDIKLIRRIFVDMLQAVFHPRISYPVQGKLPKETTEMSRILPRPEMAAGSDLPKPSTENDDPETAASESTRPFLQTKEIPTIKIMVDENDDAPLPDVPPLPRTGDHKAVKLEDNGSHSVKQNVPED